jgi:hypothetical protein
MHASCLVIIECRRRRSTTTTTLPHGPQHPASAASAWRRAPADTRPRTSAASSDSALFDGTGQLRSIPVDDPAAAVSGHRGVLSPLTSVIPPRAEAACIILCGQSVPNSSATRAYEVAMILAARASVYSAPGKPDSIKA